MSSTDLLSKDPANTGGVNGAGIVGKNGSGITGEQLRYNFLSRFIMAPNMYNTVKTVRDYLNCSLSHATDIWDYAYVSKTWRKNGTTVPLGVPEIIKLIADTDQGSFCRDVAGIIAQDIAYNLTQQETIRDDENATTQAREDAGKLADTYRNMKDRLNSYKVEFISHSVMMSEILPFLQEQMAVNV